MGGFDPFSVGLAGVWLLFAAVTLPYVHRWGRRMGGDDDIV